MKKAIIKNFLIFVLISIIVLFFVKTFGDQAKVTNIDMIKSNIATIDMVLGNIPAQYVYRDIYSIKVSKVRLPTKIYVEKADKYIQSNTLYWTPSNGLMYLALRSYMNKTSNNNMPFYQFPVGVFPIIETKIKQLNPSIYIGIDNTKKTDLLNKLQSIEDYIAKQKILTILPFINSNAPDIISLVGAFPAQVWIYNGKDKRKLGSILITFINNHTHKYIGVTLQCKIIQEIDNNILSCIRKDIKAFRKQKEIIKKPPKEWYKYYIYLYSYSQ